jgi:hypothetical protein
MTDILTGPGVIFPKEASVKPLPGKLRSVTQLRSLNQGYRDKEKLKIVHENEQFLKRLQAASATYNVCDWDQ